MLKQWQNGKNEVSGLFSKLEVTWFFRSQKCYLFGIQSSTKLFKSDGHFQKTKLWAECINHYFCFLQAEEEESVDKFQPDEISPETQGLVSIDRERSLLSNVTKICCITIAEQFCGSAVGKVAAPRYCQYEVVQIPFLTSSKAIAKQL